MQKENWVFFWLISIDAAVTYGPLDEIDAGLQVQAEIDEAPLDALPLVLLLLQDEHGVVEQLLQSLVGVVDAELLEGVILWRIGLK